MPIISLSQQNRSDYRNHNNDNVKNYHLVLCGHSLGAGVASLVGVILRSRIPQLIGLSSPATRAVNMCPTFSKSSRNHNSNKMSVYAFAPPPILDQDTAIECSSY